jgi:hypothetical protein
MSRGPGHVERVIEETMRNTDRSFTVEELALFVYPGINVAEKKPLRPGGRCRARRAFHQQCRSRPCP